MAQRRMISKSIAEDDRFVDMNPISKLLYFYLVLNADDDGFVGSVKMINFLTSAKKENYDELLSNNLILQPSNNGVYVITDWYTQNKIESKIYKPTTYLSVRALLYIKSDFAYTTDPKAHEVIAPANFWIKNGRDKKTAPEIQSQRYLRAIEETSKKVPRSVEETSSNFLAQNRLDKSRLDKNRIDQTRKDQQRAEKGNKDKDINATTTSNGGMGEVSSSTTSTSTIYNNATKETRENSEANYGDSISNYQDETGFLLDYINNQFNGEVPIDNERLTTLLADLQNEYQPQYIQQGIDEIVGQVGSNYIASQVPSLFIHHLAEAVKSIVSSN